MKDEHELERQLLEEFGTLTFSEETLVEKAFGWLSAEDERDFKAEDHFTAEKTSGKLSEFR